MKKKKKKKDGLLACFTSTDQTPISSDCPAQSFASLVKWSSPCGKGLPCASSRLQWPPLFHTSTPASTI